MFNKKKRKNAVSVSLGRPNVGSLDSLGRSGSSGRPRKHGKPALGRRVVQCLCRVLPPHPKHPGTGQVKVSRMICSHRYVCNVVRVVVEAYGLYQASVLQTASSHASEHVVSKLYGTHIVCIQKMLSNYGHYSF